jgi:MoaA/NifB/PqqE/SkfB family radical SAM enzyme
MSIAEERNTKLVAKLPKLDLNITNRCNYRCVHCAFDSGQTHMNELSLEQIARILKETKELGGEKFDITGGEPLVRKDIGDIIRIGKGFGYKIELVTNGSLLTKKKLSSFKKLGLDSIAISLDGSDYKTYSMIRQVDKKTYEKVMKSIDDALSFRYVVKINTVVFQSNLDDIANITRFCIDKGVAEHGIYYFTPIGRGVYGGQKAVEPVAWLSFIRNKLVKLNDKIKISLEVPLIEKSKIRKEIRCIANAEKYHLQILPTGNTFPCAILASYNKPVANLASTRVGDVWGNEALWRDYWQDISCLFSSMGGCCVNFKEAFNIKEYDLAKYDLVCPLRKFNIGDVL